MQSYTLLLCLTFVQPYYTDHLRKWNAMISQAGNLDDMKEGAENSGAFAGLGKSGLPSYRCSFSFLNRSQMAHFYTKLILIHPLQQCLWINYVIPNQCTVFHRTKSTGDQKIHMHVVVAYWVITKWLKFSKSIREISF